MKCTNCGMNNATCHYRYNINGKVTEAHLCPDCAAKMEGKADGFDFNEAFESFDNKAALRFLRLRRSGSYDRACEREEGDG